jgi:ABC-type lipoprotein export system ATPase subunit
MPAASPSHPSSSVATAPAAARLTGIRKTYYKPDGSVLVDALRGLDLVIPRGEYIAIMGASGSGKSTLMNILGCLDRPSGGVYELDGAAVESLDDDELSRVRGQKIGFVFQAFNLITELTIVENVEVPLFYQGIAADEPTGNLDSRTGESILELFEDLHKGGLTLIMVTHDDRIAERCERVVRLRDGLIETDRAGGGKNAKAATAMSGGAAT